MNPGTEKIIQTALEMDPSISSEQRDMAMKILRHGIDFMTPVAPARPVAAADSPFPSKPYLRRHEAAKYLGCSVRQIDEMKHTGALPFHRLGRRLIVFKLQDLDVLIKRHRVALPTVTS